MKKETRPRKHIWLIGVVALALAAGLATGCKKQQASQEPAARTDQQVASDIQAKIQGESALAGQDIQVSVANGVATLSGNVTDDASRALAGNDSGTVDGVKTVVNNLTVQPAQQAQQAAAAPQPAPLRDPMRDRAPRHQRSRHEEQAQMGPPPPQPVSQPDQMQGPPRPPQPAAPPRPVIRQLTLDPGTEVPIRMTDALDTKTAQPNDVFRGSIAQDVMVNGVVAIPRGSPVLGRVVDVREAAHFKGNAFLSIQLTQVTVRGQKIGLDTDTYSQEGVARGKNTAEKAGGGAVLGAVIGALAGGGKGAAIGALAGGGAGAGVNAVTRGKQIQIPSETVLSFRLQSPVSVTVTILPSGDVQDNQNQDPQLLRR